MTNGHAIIRWLGTLAAVVVGLARCSHANDKPEPSTPEDEHRLVFDETADRLVGMLDSGWVVSRWADGTAEHTGDSLLWSGMALGVLDCARGAAVEEALLAMLQESGGRLYRHPSEKERATSLDGHLGLLWGIAHRAGHCPESLERWRGAFPVYLEAADSPMVYPFTKVREAVAARLGLGAGPENLGALTDVVAGWAALVNASHAAGYRIHLGLLSLEAVEASGFSVPSDGREKFCAATRGAGLLTTEHYCTRGNLAAWLARFFYDEFEYRFQRAVWESPDGRAGLSTPALDRLVALRVLYEPLPFLSWF